jgi:GDPmannose 4,6-dehydratase
MFVCCGILFNHESPRRGLEFVTRKICEAAKKKQKVALGNLEAKRDWGYAGDYVEAMHAMLQMPIPDDYVIATGQTHTVGEFAKLAYDYVGLNYKDYVEVDPRFMRLNELRTLKGDATKAYLVMGWKPKVDLRGLVAMMMSTE